MAIFAMIVTIALEITPEVTEMSYKKFKIKMFHYIRGEFKMFESEYESLEDAIKAGNEAKCYTFKIYDIDDHICHDSHGFGHGHETYA